MTVQLTDYVSLNRGGTPGDGSTGTYLVDSVQNLTHRVLQRLDVIGQFRLEPTNRWNGFSASQSSNNGTFSNNGGTGVDPNVDWRDYGYFIRAGNIIKNVVIAGRTNNTEVTEIDFRLYHQTGPWTGTWDSNAETTRTTVISQNAVGFNLPDQKMASFNAINFTSPSDGFLLMYARPQGTITANRYLRCNVMIEYEIGA